MNHQLPDTEWEGRLDDLSLCECDNDITGQPQTDDIKAFITSLLTTHTTYWKEKVRKEVEGMKGIYDENGLQTQWIQKAELLQALDNLK